MRTTIASQFQAWNMPWDRSPADWPQGAFRVLARLPGEEWRLQTEEASFAAVEVPRGHGRGAYDLLTALHAYGLPVAEPVVLAEERSGGEDLLVHRLSEPGLSLDAALVRHGAADTARATATLLVHLHLAGLAGEGHARWRLAYCREEAHACLIYAEGTLCEELRDARRAADAAALRPGLCAAAGQAALHRDAQQAFADDVLRRYTLLWDTLEGGRLFAEEGQVQVRTHLTSGAPARTSGGSGLDLSLRCRVVDGSGRHRLLLHLLTGMDVAGERGKHLLRDIYRYHAWLEFSSGRKWPRALAANRWVTDCYMPAVSLLPAATGMPLGRPC